MTVPLWPWISLCLSAPPLSSEPPRYDPEVVPVHARMALPSESMEGTLTGRPGTLPDYMPTGPRAPIVDVPPGALSPLLNPLPTPRGPDPIPLDREFTPPSISPHAEYNPGLLYLPDRVEERPLFVNEPHQPSGKFWMNAAYFYGTTQKDSTPTLLIAGGDSVPLPGYSGLFGRPLGSNIIDHDFRSGLQFQAGLWLDRDETFQATGEVFVLETNRASTRLPSFGVPSLGRPYIDPVTDEQALESIAEVGSRIGVVEAGAEMYLIGAQANLRHTVWSRKPAKIDLLGGYRFLRLSEHVRVASESLLLVGADGLPPGTRMQVLDAFSTENVFHGGQLGISGEYRWNRFFFDLTGTVAFGSNWQRSTIRGGQQTSSLGGDLTTEPFGLLTGAGNVGTVRSSEFAVLPGAEFTVGYAITDHWRSFVGYRFLYLSDVARPGPMIDPTVGNGRPERLDPRTDLWVQGLTLGLEMRY